MKKLLITLILSLSLSSAMANSFIDEVTDLIGASPEVNINLGTGLLNTILAFADDDDAKEVGKVLSGLNKIRVSVFDLKGNQNTADLSQLIKAKVESLTTRGFEQIITVRDSDETVNIIAKVNDEILQDAMIIVMDEGDELVIISMDGELDLKQIAMISDRFDVDLGDVLKHQNN